MGGGQRRLASAFGIPVLFVDEGLVGYGDHWLTVRMDLWVCGPPSNRSLDRSHRYVRNVESLSSWLIPTHHRVSSSDTATTRAAMMVQNDADFSGSTSVNRFDAIDGEVSETQRSLPCPVRT